MLHTAPACQDDQAHPALSVCCRTGPLKVLLLAGLVGGMATVAIKKRQQGK